MPRWLGTIFVSLAGMLLVIGAGELFLSNGFSSRLARFSYEVPFLITESDNAPQDVVMVYMTDAAGNKLQQRGGIWSRSLHAQLIRKLTAEGARAIFFDVIFSEPSEDPAADPDLADAIGQSGRVFLAGELNQENSMHGPTESVIPPLPMLRKVAAGWGLVAFRPQEEDYGVRWLYAGIEQVPSCTWRMAQWLGAKLPSDYAFRSRHRLIKYYGRVDCFDHISYDTVFAPDGYRADFFKDKIVIVGGRSSVSMLSLGKDDFRHPLTGRVKKSKPKTDGGIPTREDRREENDFAPGAEVHATILLNLLRGDWIEPLSVDVENWIIIGFGVFLGLVLPRFSPIVSGLLALLLCVSVIVAAFAMFHVFRIWFIWGVPAFVQVPIGFAWAAGSRYLLIERRRASFRKAFAHYLSPHLAARLDTEELSLAPGGTLVEASIVFTDIENFTGLCEELNDPVAVSELLTWYFTRATNQVHDNDGTVIKYVGDSVFAVWGTPLKDSRHPEKAARAACRIHLASSREIQGRSLRTRIGIHTGEVLAGNLGSLQRFDYSCIGDPVNLTARIEGLNKYLGTDVLISEQTLSRAGQGFVTRYLGQFQLAGKKSAVLIHELLGETANTSAPGWFETFARALEAYQRADLKTAGELFRQTSAERGTPDGPSEFYLEHIALIPAEALLEWDPMVPMATK